MSNKFTYLSILPSPPWSSQCQTGACMAFATFHKCLASMLANKPLSFHTLYMITIGLSQLCSRVCLLFYSFILKGTAYYSNDRPESYLLCSIIPKFFEIYI